MAGKGDIDDFLFYSQRQNNLSLTINPPGDAHNFCKEISAFARSKNRRCKRQKQKFLSFTIAGMWLKQGD